jgi:CheY-like chemotaxis protein
LSILPTERLGRDGGRLVAFRTTFLVWFVALGASSVGTLLAQPPAEGQPKAPADVFRTARDQIAEGRFDVAAETLKAFLAAVKDDDLIKIAEREPTVFLKLRGIPVWSEDPKAQAEALKTIDDIIKRSDNANRAIHRKPETIAKFIKNLGATQEERIYAEEQLVKGGDAVVPIMVETLRTSSDVELRSGIYGSLRKLGPDSIAGFLAAVEGLSDENRLGILRGIIARADVLNLLTTAETDFTGHLWYYATLPGDQAAELRTFAVQTLDKLGAMPTRRIVEAELVRIATPFTNKTARYRNNGRLKLWNWDAAGSKVVSLDATREQADEYYGIRYLKWANERNPNYQPAHELFLSFAIQRAVEKGKFGDLSVTDPALFQVAASAASPVLVRLLDQGLTTQKTALSLGLLQILAARAERAAITGFSSNAASVVLRALDYADPRVQLAAAVTVLRTGVSTHGRTAKIVDILQKAVSADTGDGVTPEMGRALISDPMGPRAARISTYLQQMGYATERYSSGKELLRRAARSGDYDLVILDRSTTDPELRDVLVQLRPGQSAARMPILVMASSAKPRAMPLESLMLRLAKLIAVTETSGIEVATPFTFDPAKPAVDLDAVRKQANRVRDFQLAELHKIRTERMHRIMQAVDLPNTAELNDRVKIRTSQLTFAVLSAEYGMSTTSATETFKNYTLLNEQVAGRKDLHSTIEGLPLEHLSKILEQLDGALDEARRKQFEGLSTRVITDHLNLPQDVSRDTELEEYLSRQLRTFASVTVIPEPFSMVGFSEEVRQAASDPAQLPRDLNEKKLSAKIAVQWLRKLALGEVDGYNITPAESALRGALRNDVLAEAAVDALTKIGSPVTQQDLVSVSITATRPAPLRIRAAERAVQHIQNFGRQIPGNQLDALQKAAQSEQNPELRGKLLILSNVLATKPGDLGRLINAFPVPLPQVAAPANPMPKEGEAEKKQ